jgi:phosphoglycolate phosphatase
MYNVILFDLDGTLTNPLEGITKSALYALDKMKIDAGDMALFNRFIGPPLHSSFQDYYSLSAEDASRAVAFYREYYAVRGMYENEVYAGIPELLAALQQEGKKLFIATTKATFFAEKVLQHFQLNGYFSMIAGSNLDGTRSAKAEIIQCILDTLPGVAKETVVMVGDRMFDIDGARANGIDSIGVTYGFGTGEELAAARPDYLASSVAQLKMLLARE